MDRDEANKVLKGWGFDELGPSERIETDPSPIGIEDVHRGVLENRKLLEGMKNSLTDLTQSIRKGGRIPEGAPGFVTYATHGASAPVSYMSIVGYLLHKLGVDHPLIMAAYLAGAFAIVLAMSYLRIKMAEGTDGDEESASWRGGKIGSLLFATLFFMTSTPLLQTVFNRIDPYGFYGLAGFAGTPIPILLSLVVNLVGSLLAVMLFMVMWNRQYGPQGAKSAFGRAVWIMLPPLLLVYIPLAVLGAPGSESYWLVVIALLFMSFVLIVVLQDPDVHLAEADARLMLIAVVAVTTVLFIMAMVGLILIYFLVFNPAEPVYNRFWYMPVDWNALGYPESEFTELVRVGYVWMVMCGVAYMIAAVGGYLIATIWREGILPHRQNPAAFSSQ